MPMELGEKKRRDRAGYRRLVDEEFDFADFAALDGLVIL
jgi:hypothetical protein